MYRGPACSYSVSGLHSDTEYSVRVSGTRISGADEVVGIPSVDVVFRTPALRSSGGHGDGSPGSGRTAGVGDGGLLMSRWTDQQCAVMLLVVFTVCALLTAFLAQQVVVVYSSTAVDDPTATATTSHPHVH